MTSINWLIVAFSATGGALGGWLLAALSQHRREYRLMEKADRR